PGDRIAAGAGPVQHHLGDRELALERFPARLEIDGVGEAILLGAGGLDRAQAGDIALEGQRGGRGDIGEADHVLEGGDAGLAGQSGGGPDGRGRRGAVEAERAHGSRGGGMIVNPGLGRGRSAGETQRGDKKTRGRRSAKKLEHIEIWSLPGGEVKPSPSCASRSLTPGATPARSTRWPQPACRGPPWQPRGR